MNEVLVLVRWHDAWFDVDQQTEPRTDYLVETVGFRLGADARYLHVAAERLPEGEGFRAITHIPVPCVEEIVTLALAELEPAVLVLNGGRAPFAGSEQIGGKS